MEFSIVAKTRTVSVYVIVFLIAPFLYNLIYSPNTTLVNKTVVFCEIYGDVVRVVDGDTIDYIAREIYSSKHVELRNREFRIRLADINAPELSTPEGEIARDALRELFSKYGWRACIDIDDYGEPTDRYGRFIAVVYVKYNETHWLNINKWLLTNGYAQVVDFKDNEFNPYNWSIYVEVVFTTPIQSIDNNWLEKLLPNSIFVLITIAIVTTALVSIIVYSIGKRTTSY